MKIAGSDQIGRRALAAGLVAGALIASSPRSWALEQQIAISARSTDCPRSASVTVQIGSLRLTDTEDPDFSSLSGATLQQRFVRIGALDCVFGNAGPDSLTNRHDYLEIRRQTDGSRAILIEGYTPRNGKLFSIRAKAAASSLLNAVYKASIYDESSPSRAKLGPAILSLQSEE